MKTFPKNTIYLLVFVMIALLFGVQLYVLGLYRLWQAWIPVSLWLIGGVLGYLTLGLDRLVDLFIANPDTKLAFYVKDFITRGKFNAAWKVLKQNKQLQVNLTFRSAVFHCVWLLLALFTITSTTSLFGKGFVLGLGLHLLLDEWEDYLGDKPWLKQWLFWQINRDFTDQEAKIFLWGMTGMTTLLFLSVIYS